MFCFVNIGWYRLIAGITPHHHHIQKKVAQALWTFSFKSILFRFTIHLFNWLYCYIYIVVKCIVIAEIAVALITSCELILISIQWVPFSTAFNACTGGQKTHSEEIKPEHAAGNISLWHCSYSTAIKVWIWHVSCRIWKLNYNYLFVENIPIVELSF